MKYLLIIIIFLATSLLQTQDFNEVIRESSNEHEHYGWVMDTYGDWLVIGSPHSTTEKGDDAGKIHIYKKDALGNWSEHQEIRDGNGNAFQNFGFSVGIYEDNLVVGAVGTFHNGPFTGSVYQFKLIDDQWIFEGKVHGEEANDWFGYSVAAGEDYSFYVGAINARENDDSPNTGAMYYFSGINENYIKSVPHNAASDDKFASSIAYEDGNLFISSPNSSVNGKKSGLVYKAKKVITDVANTVFTYEEIAPNSPDPYDYFGSSLVFEDGNLYVGAFLSDGADDNTGSVYMFSENNYFNGETQKIFYENSERNDQFGLHFDVKENMMVIASPKANTDDFLDVGKLYVYELNGDSWEYKSTLDDPDQSEHNYFGSTVVLGNQDLFVSARLSDNQENDGGTVYIASVDPVSIENEISFDMLNLNSYPNPSSTNVNIKYSLWDPSKVELSIYDINGNLVVDLLNEDQVGGEYVIPWNLTDMSGNRVSSGVYIYELHINGNKFTNKLVVN